MLRLSFAVYSAAAPLGAAVKVHCNPSLENATTLLVAAAGQGLSLSLVRATGLRTKSPRSPAYWLRRRPARRAWTWTRRSPSW